LSEVFSSLSGVRKPTGVYASEKTLSKTRNTFENIDVTSTTSILGHLVFSGTLVNQ